MCVLEAGLANLKGKMTGRYDEKEKNYRESK